MLAGYLNYPNSQVTAHGDMSCGDIRKMHKVGQRNIRIDPSTFTDEIQRFIQGEHRFASEPQLNDMWVNLDFDDWDFELALFDFIHRLVRDKYKPFRNVARTVHCTG